MPHYLGFLVRRVCFGVAENEANVFGELHGVLIIPLIQRFGHCAQIHGRVDDVSIVLNRTGKKKTKNLHPREKHTRCYSKCSKWFRGVLPDTQTDPPAAGMVPNPVRRSFDAAALDTDLATPSHLEPRRASWNWS